MPKPLLQFFPEQPNEVANNRPYIIVFTYKNWRHEHHAYIVRVESIEFGYYHGDKDGANEGPNWLLHGDVISRDGKPHRQWERRDREFPRRSFLLRNMGELEVQEDAG